MSLNISATLLFHIESPKLFSSSTDRLQFQNILNQQVNLNIKLKSNFDIDEAVNNLTTLIQSAAWAFNKPRKTNNRHSNFHLVSDQIRSLIVEKRTRVG